MIHARKITREPIEVSISLDALDELKAALPVQARHIDEKDTRTHLMLWVPGITLKIVGVTADEVIAEGMAKLKALADEIERDRKK